MVSVRQRRKNKSSIPKVTRKSKDKSKVKILSNPIIAAQWDEKLTLQQNYKKMGLTARIGRPAGGVEKNLLEETSVNDDLALSVPSKPVVAEARIKRNPETGKIEGIEYANVSVIADTQAINVQNEKVTDVVRELEALAQRGERILERKQSTREQEWLEKLYKLHGDDYEAMARDKKRNIYQQTPGDLRRRILKWKKKSL
ncbi:ribosome biogenesis protein Nop16 [Lipomyces oligophaga]|uniref:ribosome biogenesis protein Nop16 n=1 Tax=Lipomyces oligophaga TaxID=45792 RepID=UPI0034CD02C8